MARLVVKNELRKDLLQWDWTMCPESRHHSKFNSEHCNWEGLCDHFQRKNIFTLISYNFCTSTSHLRLEMTSSWFIAIAIRLENSQSNLAAKIGCGVESAHSRATHLGSRIEWKMGLQNWPSQNTTEVSVHLYDEPSHVYVGDCLLHPHLQLHAWMAD